MDKIQQPIIKDNNKTIAQTIEESGLNSLEENPPSDDLYLAIQKLVELSSGRDEAWRKIAVSDITKVLNEINVSSADELAKSALFPKKQKPDSLNGNSFYPKAKQMQLDSGYFMRGRLMPILFLQY